VKPVPLPPEAEIQLAEYRALVKEAERAVARAESQLREITAQAETETRRAREVVQAMIDDKLVAAELIAEAWADYETAIARARAQVLRAKATPAKSAADEIRAKGKELAALRREAKYTQWVCKLYEWHFPWLSELRDDEEARAYLGQLVAPAEEDPQADPVSYWLTPEEFAKLGESGRNQRALNRYLASRKSPWELGRDYERYIGYLREMDGWAVTYQGIFEGLDDLGRDLLARKKEVIEVIQCKRWAQHKTIHEKHVFQLFGTVVAARIEHPQAEVRGTFTTTTSLSDRARRFADELEITVEEQVPLADYPRIKCNIGGRTGERIYHLPFDQQYDTTMITRATGEGGAETGAEAEAASFRRAWRWRGTVAS
jgi:hypothetical protein